VLGVICLSRYLQHLTLTGYQTLYPVKYSNAVMSSALFHRVNNLIIYKLSSYTAIAKPAAPYFAKTAPYRFATGTLSLLTNGTINQMAAPVTQTPSIAVPLCLSSSVSLRNFFILTTWQSITLKK